MAGEHFNFERKFEGFLSPINHETDGATEYAVFLTGKRRAGRRYICLIYLVRS